ncbi:MAG TPA: UvrB/UvrC motif-containing protein [Victivallales bacterium]|nr:UvrB/UvrC motif-containing protein [Victivallales bacterium]
MLCEICKKNKATIHIQEIINNTKKTLHICQCCADKKGVEGIGPQGINISEILYNLSTNTGNLDENDNQIQNPIIDEPIKKITSVVCPKCKLNLEKFKKTGRLGCENCYSAFQEILSETLRNMHRGTVHMGKKPSGERSDSGFIKIDLINLQRQLDEHIKKEEYEKAAKIRDQINDLKNHIGAING